MVPVRVIVEERSGIIEYTVHVVNRAQHALKGALRAGWKRYPNAKAVSAEYIEHACAQCKRTHTITPVRRAFNRTPKRGAA